MALRNQDDINRDLAEHESSESEFQKKVLEYVKPLIKMASDRMVDYHAGWDNYDWIYRGYKVPDRDDKSAVEKKEPPKIIVPLTYAQIQTAVSFVHSTYLQKNHFYEFRGMGPEDEKNVFALEEDISYQLYKNAWPLKLYYLILDAFKYGFGVVKCDWEEKYCKMRVQKKVPRINFLSRLSGMFNGNEKPEYDVLEEIADVIEYQGNRIRNISPYSFYPDPDVSVANFQEGSFVCHEEERAKADLRKYEGQMYFGIDHIPDTIPQDVFTYRRRRNLSRDGRGGGASVDKTLGMGSKELKHVINTEICVMMSGKMVNKEFGCAIKPDSTYQERWVVSLGNDMKVIRFEPLGALHNMYPYAAIEYSPDHNAFFNPGLAETVSELQGLVNFFLNSHVVNVRKIIKNQLIGNPKYVNMEDIERGEHFIRTKETYPGEISRHIMQLQMTDVTKNHVGDVDNLMRILQVTTGVNENALGQYASGRRSATESRNVNAGAAARLKMHAMLAWSQGIEPLGKMILSNTRQARTKPVYEQIVGKRALEALYEEVILADPNKIAGGYDFKPFDATLPSDRAQFAQLLQELFTTLISNEQAMMILQKDPTKLLNHMAELYGIKNLKEFDLTPDEPLLPPPQAQVVSDETAQQAVDGGATPIATNPAELMRDGAYAQG